MKTTNHPKFAFADLPTDYRSLCMDVLLPRPIRTRVEYRGALKLAELLAGHDLTEDQDDYLEALTTFIEEWESDHEPQPPKVPPIEVLSMLLHENGLNGSGLANILGTSRSLVSRILSGERSLTTAHIKALSDRFNIDPTVFMPE